jgi:hypothetical protein
MKRLLAVAAIIAAPFVFATPSVALTHAQQDAAIAALKAKLNCLTRTPVTEFGDPAGSDWGYLWDNTADDAVLNPDFGVSALDFNFGAPNAQIDAWLVTVKNTSTCRGRFAVTPTPSWWPSASASLGAKAARMVAR